MPILSFACLFMKGNLHFKMSRLRDILPQNGKKVEKDAIYDLLMLVYD